MKKRIKLFLSTFLFYSGLLYLFRFWNNLNGKRLLILTFHRVSKNDKITGLPTISITHENFKSLLKFLKKRYSIISLKDYLQTIKNGTKLDDNCLILSFDDCYKDILDNALPVLKKYNMPAILFAPIKAINEGEYFWWDVFYLQVTRSDKVQFEKSNHADSTLNHFLQWIERVSSEPPRNKIRAMAEFIEALQKAPQHIRSSVTEIIIETYKSQQKNQNSIPQIMQWEDIEGIYTQGFEIGSHTVSHRFLASLPDEEVIEELTESKQKLENSLAEKITCFCYPGGKYNKKTVELVKQAGYQCAVTTNPGLNATDSNLFELKRINIWDGMVTDHKGKFSKKLTAWHLLLQR